MVISFLCYASVSVCRAGDIEGFVKFPGETPPGAMIAQSHDTACPAGIPTDHLQVRQENRGLKNALVILSYSGDHRLQRATPAGLKSEKCRFFPRMQWVPLPAYLTMTNLSDGEQDIRATIDGVRVFEVALAAKGESVRRTLSRPKLYRLDSDRRPWMRAWIYASNHPYVAVTDGQGFFRIRDVPAGRYTISAWHEGWTERSQDRSGRVAYQPVEQTMTVKVPDDDRVEVVFEGLEPTF